MLSKIKGLHAYHAWPLALFWWRRGRVELPVQKKLPRTCYRLSQLFNLAWLASANRVQPDQPVFLSPPAPASGWRHPSFATPIPNPPGWGQDGCAAYLIRQRMRIHVRRIYFATSFMRERHLSLQSCYSPPLSKPRVPIF